MTTTIQRTFATGELSPELRSRSDVSAYSAGFRYANNTIVGKTGGAFDRAGTTLHAQSRFDVGRVIGCLFHGDEMRVILIEDSSRAISMSSTRLGYFVPNQLSTVVHNGDFLPYLDNEISGLHTIIVPDGILITHRRYPPILIRLDETGFPVYEVYSPERSTVDIARGTLSANRVGSSGTTTYDYAITEVDSFGRESRALTASITNGHANLNTERYVNVRFTLPIPEGETNPEPAPAGREYNIYKAQGGVFHLLSIATIEQGGTSVEVRDIGQSLSSDKVLPVLRPEIAPLVYTPVNSSVLSGNHILRVEPVNTSIGEGDPAMLEAGDDVIFCASYDDSAGNSRVINTINLTVVSVSVITNGIFVTFTTDALPTDPVTFTGGMISRLGNNPRYAATYQNRLIYASTENAPDTIWLSRLGNFADFSRPSVLDDVSPFSFRVNSVEGGEIKGIIDVNGLKVFTEDSEWAVYGNDAGVITPTQINAREVSNYGSSDLRPLKVGDIALFQQKRGGIIRSVPGGEAPSLDVSIFSSHFFKDNLIIDWGYVKRPTQMIWAIRDDGLLLSFTIEPTQSVNAWCRHELANISPKDFLKPLHLQVVDDVPYVSCSYMSGRATTAMHLGINDRFKTNYSDVFDLGLRLTATSFPLSDLPNYKTATSTRDDGLVEIDVSSLTSFRFNSTNVGTYIFYERSGEYIADEVISVDENVRILVKRNVATTHEVSRSELLVGVNRIGFSSIDPYGYTFNVAIVADGNLIESSRSVDVTPGNPQFFYELGRGYREVKYGLPFASDFQTLDVELTGPTITQNYKKITEVNMYVDSIPGLYVGNARPSSDDSTDGLALIRPDRRWERDGALMSSEGIVSVVIDPTWNSSGSIFVRRVDAVPFAVYSIVPSGDIPSDASGGTGG